MQYKGSNSVKLICDKLKGAIASLKKAREFMKGLKGITEDADDIAAIEKSIIKLNYSIKPSMSAHHIILSMYNGNRDECDDNDEEREIDNRKKDEE